VPLPGGLMLMVKVVEQAASRTIVAQAIPMRTNSFVFTGLLLSPKKPIFSKQILRLFELDFNGDIVSRYC
jgi:hypothetical protein